jgi:hypothetical protein
MSDSFHILNGDALLEQFPKEIEGARIVARECLVDGEVQADNLESLYQLRARFLATHYGGVSQEDYFSGSVAEFEKIQNLPEGSEVNLWFEDDLFCQVNLWFVSYLLFRFGKDLEVYLIRPKTHTPYGFGGLSAPQLIEAIEHKVPVSDLEKLAAIWTAYQQDDREKLIRMAQALQGDFPFILTAAKAHLARIPTADSPGRPTEALQEIMEELDFHEFGPVFRAFCQRESIYGFGDVMVKRLYDQLNG